MARLLQGYRNATVTMLPFTFECLVLVVQAGYGGAMV